MENKTYHAWYSATSAALHGTVTYERENGEHVMCTMVCESNDCIDDKYRFKDKVYRGEVVKFVKSDVKNRLTS
jgi:diaminopimelate decarboxylase